MKLFFDECVPRPLARLLAPHSVQTAQELGWGRKTNGELLRLVAEAGFECFITSDQNLPFQQYLQQYALAILVLPTNNWMLLRTQEHSILAALATAEPGLLVHVQLLA